MEREKAVKVAKALDSIDSFELFADEVEKIVQDWDDCFVSSDFITRLYALMDEEMAKRKKVLEDL